MKILLCELSKDGPEALALTNLFQLSSYAETPWTHAC